MNLQEGIETLFEENPDSYSSEQIKLFEQFRNELNSGAIRAAQPHPDAAIGWQVNAWVKKGILLGFRMGKVVAMGEDVNFQFYDKSTYPLRKFRLDDGVRIVPGGSSVRDGCYIGRGVTCMPPMFINVGAYVGDGTMVDSHALIGSCAQVGANCHISAASQIGGVLEPVGAMPVIVEDNVLIGGNCGIYEGTVIRSGAVIGSGTVLNRSMPLYDLVFNKIYRASGDTPLVVPERAVVVPGSRQVESQLGKEWGLSLYTPVIVKYRDAATEAKIELEDLLR